KRSTRGRRGIKVDPPLLSNIIVFLPAIPLRTKSGRSMYCSPSLSVMANGFFGFITRSPSSTVRLRAPGLSEALRTVVASVHENITCIAFH
ncbi:unnamed protein product, partial [Musa acuminata var. zebrina]